MFHVKHSLSLVKGAYAFILPLTRRLSGLFRPIIFFGGFTPFVKTPLLILEVFV